LWKGSLGTVEREVEDVTAAVLEHVGPWTEEDYFDLGETHQRIELFDGSLIVSPSASMPHQRLSRRLANTIEPAAEDAGLLVMEAINVRLRPGRVPIPDVVVADTDGEGTVLDASRVRLVCEIVSTNNASTDWVLKMRRYADARIPWYLIVEQKSWESLTLHLFRLDSDKYVEHDVARVGDTLRLTDPFILDLDVAALMPR
jgi:Uma2 family endonuclease